MVKRKRKLKGVWDAERILNEYIRRTDEKGYIGKINKMDNSPHGIEMRRLAAAMKAYGKDIEEDPSFELLYCNTRFDKRSLDKYNDFRQLLKIFLLNPFEKIRLDGIIIENSHDIEGFFVPLFKYRKALYKLSDINAGVISLCGEKDYLIEVATRYIYRNHLEKITHIIDDMLVSLMANDFDRSFTEEELLAFGYPDVSDKELEDLDHEWI